MSARSATILAVTSLLALCGCGSHGTGKGSTPAPAPAASSQNNATPAPSVDGGQSTMPEDHDPTSPAQPAPAIRPVTPGRPGSASAVLHRYALLYGNLCSCSRAAATLDELATLATPGLAAQLRRAALSARAAVAHGLPEPARAVGSIATLELALPHGTTQTGLVVLVERTAIAHQGTTAPAPVAYTARLALTATGWRVASFQPVLPNQPSP